MRLTGDEKEEERDTNSKTPKVSKMTSSRHQTQGKRASKTAHKSTRLTPQPQDGGEEEEGRGEERMKAGGGEGKMALDVNKLKSILKGYGEYPAKYRYVCVVALLQFACTVEPFLIDTPKIRTLLS